VNNVYDLVRYREALERYGFAIAHDAPRTILDALQANIIACRTPSLAASGIPMQRSIPT
jgi:hypothetical protein